MNNELKDKIYSLQADHQKALEQLREDMIGRYYATLEENSSPTFQHSHQNSLYSSANLLNAQSSKRAEEREKKGFEKKIMDLTKTNRQITH